MCQLEHDEWIAEDGMDDFITVSGTVMVEVMVLVTVETVIVVGEGVDYSRSASLSRLAGSEAYRLSHRRSSPVGGGDRGHGGRHDA